MTTFSNSPVDAAFAVDSVKIPADTVALPLVATCSRTDVVPLPVRFGVPLPRGLLSAEHVAAAVDFGEVPTGAQATPMAHWSDGSIRWLLVDSLPSTTTERTATLYLWRVDESVSAGVRVCKADDVWIVQTGKAAFHIDARTFRPFRAVEFADEARCLENAAEIQLVDAEGRTQLPSVERLIVESTGRVRTTLRASGIMAGSDGLRWTARLSFFAASEAVLLRFAIHNPHAARHRGGIWDLGDRGSRFFRSLDLTLKRPSGGDPSIRWKTEPNSPVASEKALLSIYQGSSGGKNWQSRNHVDRHGRAACTVPGYIEESSRGRREGSRAQPLVACESENSRVAVAIPDFWQQFPKAIDVSEEEIRVGLFPGRWSDGGSLFELQGGERKTHSVWLSYDATSASTTPSECPLPLEGVLSPHRVGADPAWVRDSRAIDGFATREDDADDRFQNYTDRALVGPWSVTSGREAIDEYGWRNFGDVWANHEGLHYTGPAPVISHYNNQFDYLNGAILQWLRSGDERWQDIFEPLAEHVMDIDRYHTVEDRAAYNGGLFWFTDHYLSAATSTHRTYSKENAPAGGAAYGGGPGSEHNFATGLLHYYYVTGNDDAREAVVGLAEWVIAMDDGRRTVLGFVDDGPTGLASAHWNDGTKCPGRGAANSIQVLIDAWQLARDERYLAKAEALIRRSIHPRDDVAGMNLLNAEKNWSYTMFLAALDRYLVVKAEAGQIDDDYAYAQESYVRYARWMLDHERPYLERREELEYPTEAWAAQEFRKANVLRRAARHVDAETARRMFDRGTSLIDRAWRDLQEFETQATTRAMAVVLTEGMWDSHLRSCEPSIAPRNAAPVEFGQPCDFRSQRVRVRKRMKSAGGLVGLVGAALSFPFRSSSTRSN